MFHDAVKGRGVIIESKRNDPLSVDEVMAVVRGRHRWNPETKEWEVAYKATRDQWLMLLMTVSDRLFAMPVPKVIPTKILAQFEQEEATMRAIKDGTFSLIAATQNKAQGIDKRYTSVRDKQEPLFMRELDKTEAGVVPQGPSISLK